MAGEVLFVQGPKDHDIVDGEDTIRLNGAEKKEEEARKKAAAIRAKMGLLRGVES